MKADLKHVLTEMTGMELLWIKMHSNAATRRLVDAELDRRASLSDPGRRLLRRAQRSALRWRTSRRLKSNCARAGTAVQR